MLHTRFTNTNCMDCASSKHNTRVHKSLDVCKGPCAMHLDCVITCDDINHHSILYATE